MEEWIAKILGSRALTGLLTRSNFFRAFADAAPGGMELGHDRQDVGARAADALGQQARAATTS